MPASLARQFHDAGFAPVVIGEVEVHPVYRTHIQRAESVRLTWLSSRSPRMQGVALRLRLPGVTGKRGEGGLLRANGVEAPAIMLWEDSAPPIVEIECVKLQDTAELWVSNRWRTLDGVEHEWLNNFGIIVEEAGRDAVVLHCSDGYGQSPTFDDLVVRLDQLRHSTAAPDEA
jgi:hypothetical protein